MVDYVGRAMRRAGITRPIIVVGYQGDLIRATLGEEDYAYTYQQEQLGTGHAALMAREMLHSHDGPVIVMSGDVPLIRPETFEALLKRHLKLGVQATIATFVIDDPHGYGRIVRGKDGAVEAIVEEKDCNPHQRAIKEVNPSVYCFDRQALYDALPKLGRGNAQGEYYLTDVIAELRRSGGKVEAMRFEDATQFTGVNDRWQLAEVSRVKREEILKRHALNGVTIVDPATTYIGAEVELAADVCLQPMTMLEGRTQIGPGSVIGPGTRITDCTIGESCTVVMSNLNRATMHDNSRCGPFAHLRPGAEIGECSRVGNFVEVKNSTLAEHVSASHLTYLGDATVGAHTNVGAGTITCNYDGYKKNRTEVGEGVFIGSHTTLVAPVKVGDGAFTAAGSVITTDVPADALGIGRGRQENKEQWAKKWRERNQASQP